jgi:hypothetical protein
VGPKWKPKRKNRVYRTLKRRGALLQGDLYKKFFSRGLGALAHHQGALVQPANLLLRFQQRAGTNRLSVTCLRYHQRPLSRELAVLAYHCRELVVPAYLQNERVKIYSFWS